jgi:hypothetical protein
MPSFEYQLASPINIVEADRVTAGKFEIDFETETLRIVMVWKARDGSQEIRPIRTEVTLNQWETFLDNYATFPGTTFEEKILGLAAQIEPEIPGGGTVVPVE